MEICSGCDHALSSHVQSVTNDLVCLDACHTMSGDRRCDCVNYHSKIQEYFREVKKKQETDRERRLDSLVNSLKKEGKWDAKAIPCS